MSGSDPTTAPGTYHWTATYNGDSNNFSVSSGCADEPVTITQAQPAISTTQCARLTAGHTTTDNATVTGNNNPSGTVTFNLYGPGATASSATLGYTDTKPLLSVPARRSSDLTTAPGTYHWTATYNGDSNNFSVSSGCADEPVTITQAQPAI